MLLLPKDPPLKNQKFMDALKRIVDRCEHPGGCNYSYVLDTHHIVGRGLGGGKRKDTPGNLVILCREHHNEAHRLGVKYRPMLYEVIDKRPEHEKRQIRAFLRKQAA